MIICSSCHHPEIPGALFCSECGAQLYVLEEAPAKTTASYGRRKSRPLPADALHPPPHSLSTVSLRIVDGGIVLELSDGEEFTLGRVSGEQPIMPDIDLTPYRAYEEGVSRLHATMKITPTGITITDLGSANGTRINGQRLSAHTPQSVEHGDLVNLGKLKIQILISQPKS